MIKKLIPTPRGFDEKPQMPTAAEFLDKINELVDVVNKLQEEAENNARIRANHEHKIAIVGDLRKQVRELQSKVAILEEHAHPTATTEPADPFAEQRKWIRKLCKFWEDKGKPENCVYGILCNIFDFPHEGCPFLCGDGKWYEYCEPVKPDDDIIYKGE